MGIQVHVHPRRKTADIGKSNADLIDLIRRSGSDPDIKRADTEAAIRVLAARGINPRTGQHVGMREAMKVSKEMISS